MWARLPASRMASHSRQQLINTRPIPQKLSRIGKRPKSRPESCRKKGSGEKDEPEQDKQDGRMRSGSGSDRILSKDPESFLRIRNPLPGVWTDPNKV